MARSSAMKAFHIVGPPSSRSRAWIESASRPWALDSRTSGAYLCQLGMPGSDLFTGTLDLLILKAVSWGPRHGYAIGRWIRETTADVLVAQEGVLYPALHRLEQRGLLDEQWGRTETGRQAKL